VDYIFDFTILCIVWICKRMSGREERGDGTPYLFECAAGEVEVNQWARSLHPHST